MRHDRVPLGLLRSYGPYYRLFEMRTFRGGPPSNRQAGGSGCLAGIDVSNAPSPELAKTVSYQGIPNLDGKVTLKVYAPYYQGKEPQTSTATPATPPSAGGTPPSASAGGAGGLVTCGSPGGGLLITTSVNTSCSINFAAALGVPVNLFSDMRLKGQPSHGTAFWSKWHADLYPAPGYSGRDTITMSGTVMGAANGQSVNLGRHNTV